MRTWLAPALAALVASTALAGCLGGAADVVASAPKKGNGLTVTVSTSGGALGGPPDETEYEITYHGEKVYPPPGLETLRLDDKGLASKFVGYRDVVVGNGDYKATVGDGDAAARVNVQKYVNYVFLNPFIEERDGEEDLFVIDTTLQAGEGGDPQNRIIAKGEMTLDINYRGENGSVNQSAHSFSTITNPDRTFTRVSFPVTDMEHYKGEGFYSVDVSFDNLQADGNLGVGLDPTLREGDPPRNWVYVEDSSDENDGPLPPPP